MPQTQQCLTVFGWQSWLCNMTHIKRCPSFTEPPVRWRLTSTAGCSVAAALRSAGRSDGPSAQNCKKKKKTFLHRIRGGFCSSCPASWKQASASKAAFHGCFDALPASYPFVCQDDTKGCFFTAFCCPSRCSSKCLNVLSLLSHSTQICCSIIEATGI